MFSITAVAPTTENYKATEQIAMFSVTISTSTNDTVADNNNQGLNDISNGEEVANVDADELELENEAEPVDFAKAILTSFVQISFIPISFLAQQFVS